MKKLLTAVLLLLSANVFAQLDYSWGDLPGANDGFPNKMVMDANGFAYVIADQTNTTDDISVKKYNRFGPVATFAYDNIGGKESGVDLAVDAAGNVFALGTTTVNSNLDDTRMIVLKFTPAGVVFVQLVFPQYGMKAYCLRLDNAGNCYVQGSYIEVGTGIRRGIVAGLSNSLDINWTSTYNIVSASGWNTSIYDKDMAIGTGSFYVMNSYQDDGGLQTKLVKYDLNGNVIWDKVIGGAYRSTKIAIDNAENIYTAGYAIPTTGFPYATLIKYNSAGVLQSYRQLDSSTTYYDMKIDDDNSVYLMGGDSWYHTAFAVKYNDGANPTWIKFFNDGSNGGGVGGCMTLTNNSVLIGQQRVYYYPSIHYSSFVFLCDKITGNNIMTNQNTSAQFQTPYMLAADKLGNCFVMDIMQYGRYVYCLHYPVAVVTQAITTPGIYIFTSQGGFLNRPSGTAHGEATSSSSNIATMNVNSITGTGDINVGFNSVEPINPTFTGGAPANISPYSWSITKSDGITAINAEVRFDYTQIPNSGGVTDPSGVVIWKRDTSGTGSFSALPTTLVGTELRATVTSFGEFIFVSPSPLPVELASFTSLVNRNSVELRWTTSSEINNRGFAVERKLAGSKFAEVGFVNGNGNSNLNHSYSFNDANLQNGIYQYRLKQTDYNGNYKYYNLSSEVVVGIPVKYSLSQNYPNPFNPTTKINYEIPKDGMVSMKLYDMTGRVVYDLVNEVKAAGYYTVNFNAAGLSSGIYFYRISAGDFVSVKKMNLVK